MSISNELFSGYGLTVIKDLAFSKNSKFGPDIGWTLDLAKDELFHGV
jgi:hypothetical protein